MSLLFPIPDLKPICQRTTVIPWKACSCVCQILRYRLSLVWNVSFVTCSSLHGQVLVRCVVFWHTLHLLAGVCWLLRQRWCAAYRHADRQYHSICKYLVLLLLSNQFWYLYVLSYMMLYCGSRKRKFSIGLLTLLTYTTYLHYHCCYLTVGTPIIIVIVFILPTKSTYCKWWYSYVSFEIWQLQFAYFDWPGLTQRYWQILPVFYTMNMKIMGLSYMYLRMLR